MNIAASNPHPPRSLSRPLSLSRAGYLFLAVFTLIVFEGAVRKWIAPSSTLPLILLRDLLAIGLIFHAWSHGHFKNQKLVTAVLLVWSCLVFGWGLIQLIGGESSPVIFVIGLRFWLLYVWFAVAAAASLSEADYRAALFVAAFMLLVMAPLAVLQHYSPTSARINTQSDGDEASVFVVVTGVVRTTGTFSFTSGYANFMTLVAPAVFALLGARKQNLRNFLFALAVFVAFVAGTMVSGSRTAVITSGLMFGAYLLGRLLFSKARKKPAAAGAVVAALLLTALFALVFREAIDVTQTRFEQASAAEDFGARVLVILFGEPLVYDFVTWLGFGLGYGSNLATYVRTGSNDILFALAESEGGRILMEGGLIGFVFVALKLVMVGWGIAKSVFLSARTNSPYPLIMWLATAIAVITWPTVGQLSSNGLVGVMLALALLLFRYPRTELFAPRTRRP